MKRIAGKDRAHMRYRWLSIAFALSAGCSSRSTGHVVAVPSIAQQAFKDWCSRGRLEMESKLESPSGKPLSTNPNLLVFQCYRTTPTQDPSTENGHLAFDSKTNQLIGLTVTLHASTARSFLDRVLVPGLDAKQQQALDELFTWAGAKDKKTADSKIWKSDTLNVAFAIYPQSEGQAEPEWHISAVLPMSEH